MGSTLMPIAAFLKNFFGRLRCTIHNHCAI